MSESAVVSPTHPAYDAGGFKPFWFDVASVRNSPRIVSGSDTTVFHADREYRRIENTQVYPDFLSTVKFPTKMKLLEPITRESSNEAVCIPDPSDANKWTYVGDGACTCTISSASRSVDFNVTLAEYSETAFEEFTGYKSDSLAFHILDTVKSRITQGGEKQIYSTMDHTGEIYVRNPNCWVFDLPAAVAPFSVWNSNSGQRKAGTLVTPQDIAFTVHYQLSVGDILRFVGIDGTVYNREITAKRTHPDYVPISPDLALAHLDSPLPANVPFAKIIPADWKDYLPTQGYENLQYNYPGNFPFPLPMFAGDQEKKATLIEWVGDAFNLDGLTVNQRPVDDIEIASYFENKISGDSNSPLGLIVNGELVLSETLTLGGVGAGAKLYLYKDDLDAMLLDMGSAYTLTEADFSSFPTYP